MCAKYIQNVLNNKGKSLLVWFLEVN